MKILKAMFMFFAAPFLMIWCIVGQMIDDAASTFDEIFGSKPKKLPNKERKRLAVR